MRLRASPGREEDLGVDMALMLPHQKRPTVSSGCVGNARILNGTCNHDCRWGALGQHRTVTGSGLAHSACALRTEVAHWSLREKDIVLPEACCHAAALPGRMAHTVGWRGW